MRRSAHVFAPILASAAVALTSGCHHAPDPQRCVDEHNQVVDPQFCANLPPDSSQPIVGQPYNHGGYYSNGNVFIPHYYRYYYGGSGGFVPGAFVSGGSYAPLSGRNYVNSIGRTISGPHASSSSGTSRGGFGSSFSSHSSGGHAGGGE